MLGWFRRHAKILMVVLGSAAMAIFGLGPVFDELSQRGRGGDTRESQIVATWDGGKVTRVDLDRWQRGHWEAQRFLVGLRAAAENQKGDQIRSLATPIPMLRDGNQDSIDDQLVSKFLLSEAAKAEGVLVSDGMVDDYIVLASGDVGFSNRDLDDINREANPNCSLQRVKEHLKFELLASQMQQYASAGIPMVPNPTEAIELYSRSQEQVECEVLAINVEDFVGKAEENFSASELKKVYDQGKYDFEDPSGENPGFKIGPKLNVQYLEADYQVALTNEMNKLTDAEVQAEYDRLVAEKSPIVMEEVEIEDDSIQIDTSPGDGSGETSEPSGTESEAPDGVTPPPVGDTPAETPALETPAVEVPAVEVPASGAAVPATEGSFKVSKRKFQFVSTATTQETPVVEGQATAVVQSPATDATQAPVVGNAAAPVVDPALGQSQTIETPAVTTPAVSTPAVTTPAVTTPALTTPAVSTPAVVQTPAASQTETTPAAPASTDADQEDPVGGLGDIMEAAPDSTEEVAEESRKAKPLVDVAEEVKRSMCQVAARKSMEESLTKASVLIMDHFHKMLRWEEYDNKKGDPPAPLDLEAMAAKYGLVFSQTGMVDDVEILEDPIGRLGIPTKVQYNGRTQQTVVPVGHKLFNDFGNLRAFDAQTVNDLWGSQNSYLFWVEKKADTRVPEYEECEEAVKKFVLQGKALELAKAEAEAMKSKANDIRDKTLAEIFGDRAVPTGAFTWFTNYGSARYGVPSGVEAAGEDFMKTAFSLAKLEAGVAANASKDKVYVVQAIVPSRAMSEAGHDFLANQYFKYKRIPNEAFQIGQRYTRDLSLNFNQELQDSMGFKFVDR